MTDLDLIWSLGVVMVAGAALVLLTRRLAIPSIVAYIAAGLLVGPLTGLLPVAPLDHHHDDPDAIRIIAEVGIALLLFLVGLELSLDKIRDVGKVAVVAGLGQVVFTAAGGFALAMLLDFDVMASLFLATALTFSSTVVVVKLLDQKKELHALYGRIAVGIFLVQDLVVIVVLTFLAGLGDPDTATTTGMLGGLGVAFVGMAALLGVALLASRYLLPRPFGWASRSAETLFVWSLGLCFAFVVAAEWLGLSPEIGAFLAGVSLAQLDCAHELRRRVHPLMNFFIAVFFVTLGAQMDLSAAGQHWQSALVLSLFVLIGNPLIFFVIIARGGYGARTAFLTSVTVAQISEFSFIFAAVGLSAGLIGEEVLAIVTVVGLVTIAVSSYLILYNHQLYRLLKGGRLLRLLGGRDREDEQPPTPLSDHVVVVGMNALGQAVARGLHEAGETVLAVDTDPRKLRDLPCRTLNGNIDHLGVVEETHLDQARLLISALHIEDVNNLLAWRCRALGVPAAIHGFDRSVIRDLQGLGVARIIDSKGAVIGEIGEALRARREAGA